MKNPKPRSFFDVLHGIGAQDVDASQSQSPSKVTSPAPAPVRSSASPVMVQRSEVKGVSVAPRGDNFYLIIVVLISLSVVTGLLGFTLGKKYGFQAGVEQSLAERSSRQIPAPVSLAPSPLATQRPPLRTTQVPAPVKALPVQPRQAENGELTLLESDHAKKSFTLKVQEFGRGHVEETQQLTDALKQAGFEAFNDPQNGYVYVGRFLSIRDSEARDIKKKLAVFKWKKSDLSGCYFVNLRK